MEIARGLNQRIAPDMDDLTIDGRHRTGQQVHRTDHPHDLVRVIVERFVVGLELNPDDLEHTLPVHPRLGLGANLDPGPDRRVHLRQGAKVTLWVDERVARDPEPGAVVQHNEPTEQIDRDDDALKLIGVVLAIFRFGEVELDARGEHHTPFDLAAGFRVDCLAIGERGFELRQGLEIGLTPEVSLGVDPDPHPAADHELSILGVDGDDLALDSRDGRTRRPGAVTRTPAVARATGRGIRVAADLGGQEDRALDLAAHLTDDFDMRLELVENLTQGPDIALVVEVRLAGHVDADVAGEGQRLLRWIGRFDRTGDLPLARARERGVVSRELRTVRAFPGGERSGAVARRAKGENGSHQDR